MKIEQVFPWYFLGGLALKENTTIEWHAEWHSHTELLLHFDDRFCVFLVYMHPEYAPDRTALFVI